MANWHRTNTARQEQVVRYLLLPVLLLLLLLAYWNRFVQDDAFISFRYASNLVQGHGLTWNPGERVEGYTNFLWTLLMALPLALGREPVPFALGLGLLCTLGTLLSTYGLGLVVFRSRLPALLAMILLGTNYSFSAYATGGLETQMQALFITAGAYLTLRFVYNGRWGYGRLVVWSLLCAGALLTRLDSALAWGVLATAVLWRIAGQSAPWSQKAARMAALLVPAGLIVGGWFVWKLSFYGGILPNTFYAKATLSSVAVLRQGMLYLFEFHRSYLLVPFAIMALFFVHDLVARPQTGILVAIVALWGLYVVWVGGGFMEFRLLVPVLPFVFVLVVELIFWIRSPKMRAALLVVVLLGSLLHAVTFRSFQAIESIDNLEWHLRADGENWVGIGQTLGELFPDEDSGVVIATTAAGAIPYYAQLETVDMLGLNDPWVARNGVVLSPRPGHQRITPHEYLVERGVNLLLGPPQVRPPDETPPDGYTLEDLRPFFLTDVRPELLPGTALVVDIPLDDEQKVTVLYLAPHPKVERVLRDRGFQTYPIRRE